MTVRTAQVLLSMLAIGFSALVAAVTADAAYGQIFRIADLYQLAGGATGIVTQMLLLTLIWFRTIRWTKRRILYTALSPIATAGIVAVLWILPAYISFHSYFLQTSFLAAIVAPTILATFFVFAWTEWSRAGFRATAPIAQQHAVLCPNCNYDLSASNESRCPECGTQHTLGELFTKLTAVDPIEQPPSSDKPKA